MFFESDTFRFRFMLEKCVYFDFWNNFLGNFSKGPPYYLGYFSFFRKIKNLKNTPNHRGDFEKFEKKIIPKIKMYTCFQHKSEGKSV